MLLSPARAAPPGPCLRLQDGAGLCAPARGRLPDPTARRPRALEMTCPRVAAMAALMTNGWAGRLSLPAVAAPGSFFTGLECHGSSGPERRGGIVTTMPSPDPARAAHGRSPLSVTPCHPRPGRQGARAAAAPSPSPRVSPPPCRQGGGASPPQRRCQCRKRYFLDSLNF